MISDEEILAEERLTGDQELLLYNISLRQDDMQTQSTDILLSKLESDPDYQAMVRKGLLDYDIHDRGRVPIAHLRVTLKGLRYCVLYSEEIEPRRQHDIVGNRRITSDVIFETHEGPHVIGEGGNIRVVYPSMVPTGKSDSGVGLALNEGQLRELSDISARRAELDFHQQELAYGVRSEERTATTSEGDECTYVVLDESIVQLLKLEPASSHVRVPDRIEGLPVVALGSGALCALKAVEEIVCPDSIEVIGSGAFRCNPKLKRLVLPARVANFEANWVDLCPQLEELVLPGMLQTIKRGVLSEGRIRKLTLGRDAREIQAGALQGSQLEEIAIDGENPFIATDGVAIYSKDFMTLIALACPVRELAVDSRCVRTDEKCCHGFGDLESLRLPDALVEIAPFSFSSTGLRRFDAPPSLETIGKKAFLNCRQLEEVALNAGLKVIGDAAFQGTSISALHIPASIERIGSWITKETKVRHSGRNCSLRIDEGCIGQFFDDGGGLYRCDDEGVHFVQLVDPELTRYRVLDETTGIDPYAFAFHEHLEAVRLPDSLRLIGDSAFKGCRSLRSVDVPDSVELIGKEAFFDSNIESFHVPAHLRELGDRALITYGAHTGKHPSSLRRIEGSSNDGSFFVRCSMLCRAKGSETSVIAYSGEDPRVVFPDEVTRIEDYAFNNAHEIEYLSLDARLSSIGANGLFTRCWIKQIHIDLPEPIEGRDCVDFFFPHTPSGVRGISLGLGSANWVNIPGIVEQLDLALATAHDYNSSHGLDDISAYEQTQLVLGRLEDPFLLSDDNRETLEGILRDHIVDICVDVALHDDRELLDRLLERGLLDEERMNQVIERVTSLRDAATSAHLLEAKRLRFSQSAFDYDL